MIRGDQIYVGRTQLNPKILQHPLMALRPVLPLRTIVDQILMERWKERQPIKRENHDCDCCRDPYRRGEGACGEPTKAFKSRRPLCIHYDRDLNNVERYAAFLRHAYDENEAVQGEGYAVSCDSFDPSESSSSGADRDREQRELNDYAESNTCPTRIHPVTQEMALRTYVGIEAIMKNEMRSPYISLNSLRKISKSPSFIQYERNK
jgi:hypothetical protein